MPHRTKHCACCDLDNAFFSPPKPVNGLPMAAIVCDLCAKHQGSDVHDLRRREKKHREMWTEHERERLEALEHAYTASTLRLTERIEQLEAELDARPVRIVEKWIGEDQIQDANEAARKAYTSRDWAFRKLTEIHMLHFEMTGERCRCGKSIAECKVMVIVDNFRALQHWEARQAYRRKRQLSHMLPRDHPGVVDARWDPDSPEAREYDPYSEGA